MTAPGSGGAGETAPAAPSALPAARTRRRRLWDRVAQRLVTFGGMAVIASILAILVVIVLEVYPLFLDPAVRPAAAPSLSLAFSPAEPPLGLLVDEYRRQVGVVSPQGLRFFSLEDGSPLETPPLPGVQGARMTSVSAIGRGPFALGLSDGRVLPLEVSFRAARSSGARRIKPEVSAGDPLVLHPPGQGPGQEVSRLAFVQSPSGTLAAAPAGPGKVALVEFQLSRALVGEAEPKERRREVTLEGVGEISALAVDGRGDELYVGTAGGRVVVLGLGSGESPETVASAQVTSGAGVGVSVLGFLLGDRTLVVGDVEGRVSTWQLLRGGEAGPRLAPLQRFQGHRGPVAAIAPSRRDKGFLTAGASGEVRLHHGTTGRTLLVLQGPGEKLGGLAYAPKADGILALDRRGRLSHWDLHNPHPEATLAALFTPTVYEGYGEGEYVWQSTGGTDDFEPKLSLTPLIYGTLKGTFYALLFAMPVALLAALYASQFMHPTLKAVVKPAVEIMAALPSVVLGFIAGLWLAPMVEKVVPALFLLPWVEAVAVVLAALAWHFLPVRLRASFRAGTELYLLIPVLFLGGWAAFLLGGVLESWLSAGDYRAWLLEVLGLTYDQRNSLVVGLAMGFAVIPIIFTIAEDSLSNVPRHLAAGSLALGATRWQTALRVVVPTASPGIFSAIMVGFGRAVGETMIVLMATGNTPVMDWSIFNGFRALSANIAVELPEAPEGSTHYRVLFLAALILFVMTFAVNTAAELVRLSLRKRYRVL